jgi:(R,R)-butanediol dehydrogenase/meso-butanediol dehydrogenase/diacetyl reductase
MLLLWTKQQNMKAAVLTAYNHVEWKEVETPVCSAGEVLIRVSYASICGSDQHIFIGEFHPRTHTPMIMGHEFAGSVVEVGEGVTGFEPGDKVAPDPIIWCGKCPACQRGHYPACTQLKLIGVDLDGGFAQYIALPPQMLYKLSPTIPDRHAALIEVLSIGFHAKNRAGVREGDTVVIWGSGKVGLCILEAVRTVTREPVFMVDILEKRLSVGPAHYKGVIPINALKEDPVKRIMQETGGKGVDIAFEAVGHAESPDETINPVRGCIQSIRGAGTVCVLGLGNETAPILFKELIWKEARIVASRVSHGEFAETIDHLNRGTLKPEALITAVLPASDTQRGFEMLETHKDDQLKILLDLS